jgi:hypothetical protein
MKTGRILSFIAALSILLPCLLSACPFMQFEDPAAPAAPRIAAADVVPARACPDTSRTPTIDTLATDTNLPKAWDATGSSSATQKPPKAVSLQKICWLPFNKTAFS